MMNRYELFKPHIPKARNMLRNMSVSHHDADDIIQDALIRVVRDYDGVSKPEPFLLKVIKNAALDMEKMNARRRKHYAAYRPPESESFPDPAILRLVLKPANPRGNFLGGGDKSRKPSAFVEV